MNTKPYDFNDDPFLDICQNIEVGLRGEYDTLPDLTDALCIFGLENSAIAVKQQFGYAKNERVSNHPLIGGIVECCVTVAVQRISERNDLTLKEYLARIEKVRRSVKTHSTYGTRGYYEFIRQFV